MDTGWNQRLQILRDQAERSVIAPLRHHGWIAGVERIVESGEYLVVSAERGGHARTCALLYSCATDNNIYKLLDGQVDAIFFQGQPYHQDSYAYGLQKPVRSVGDFQMTLIEWNRGSADGKFAPDAVDAQSVLHDEEPSRDDYRLLLSENPIDAIWLRLRQFESVKLAAKLIEDRVRKAVVPKNLLFDKAQGVAYALRADP